MTYNLRFNRFNLILSYQLKFVIYSKLYTIQIAVINHLAIRFYHNLGYSISFGTYVEHNEMFNGLFYILIQKDVYELARNNLNKIDDISFKLSIEKQFGLDVDYLSAENYQQIHLKLLNKNQHHHFDFIEIAKLVFKQLGLFE